MACILCRHLRWSLYREKPGYAAAEQRLYSDARNWGSNSDKLFHADMQQDKIYESWALWNTDRVKAFKAFLALAEAGSAWSMQEVASAYRHGWGVGTDLKQAEHWARAAYGSGSDVGLLDSARLALARGDKAAARTILEEGVGKSLPAAMTELGDLEIKEGRAAVAKPLLEGAAELGDIIAPIILARAMVLGRYGIRAIPQGVRLSRQTAEKISDEIEATRARVSDSTRRRSD